MMMEDGAWLKRCAVLFCALSENSRSYFAGTVVYCAEGFQYNKTVSGEAAYQ